MITASSFYRLHFTQQADLLQRDAVFLLSRREGDFIRDLYELDELLVEIYYRKEDEEPVTVVARSTAEEMKAHGGDRLMPRLRIRRDESYRRDKQAA